MDVERFRIERRAIDVSDFSETVIPNRVLTSYERTVYRGFAGDRAVIHAEAQRAHDAQVLHRQLADSVHSTIVETAKSIYAREDEITDPRVKRFAQDVSEQVLQAHKAHQLGFFSITAQLLAQQVSRTLPAPPPPAPRKTWW